MSGVRERRVAREDILFVMQRDLERALRKRVGTRRWGMLIDTRKCVGCHACTISCKAAYKLSPGVKYKPVTITESGRYPNVQVRFTPKSCFQCAKPSCASACPINAITKEPDGIVAMNYEKCLGSTCQRCIAGCPYDALSYDDGSFFTTDTPALQTHEKMGFFEYGRVWRRDGAQSDVIGSVRKCHFCSSRIIEGLLPLCVATCIGKAAYFGDLNDRQSLLRRTMAANRTFVMKEETGNEPQVFYTQEV